jgi:polyphosphate kinase 2 (PPK2 family)
MLIKYWLSVSDEEQERRFKKRLSDPRKRWKFSPTDLQARSRWVDYAEAKDRMFAYTDTEDSRWHVVEGDDKRAARLNLISHLLSLVPYEHLDKAKPVKLPPRQRREYLRPAKATEHLVPARYTVRSG